MALSHNSFMRGYYTIYQQAPRVQTVDKADLAGFCVAWVDCVLQHHHYEETELFPIPNKAAGRTDLMAGAVHRLETFYGGMEEVKKYLLNRSGNFSGKEVVRIMESFQEKLYSHLKAEPGEIVALAKYNTPDKPVDILGIADAADKFPAHPSSPLLLLPLPQSLLLLPLLPLPVSGNQRLTSTTQARNK